MEQKENNILIAEFIELPYYFTDNNVEAYEVYENEVHTIDELEYHKSWDWLIPVVEKIELLDKVEGCKYSVTICNDVCRIDTVNEEIVWRRDSTKIAAVYQAIIEFIKWYNLNKS